MKGMHFGQGPRCERHDIFIWTSAGVCNTCLDEIVEGVASRDREPLTEDEEEELENLLS